MYVRQIGQNQVGEGRSIATQLFGLFGLVEVLFAGTLGLDVADDAVGAIPDAGVGVAGLGGLGEGGDVNTETTNRQVTTEFGARSASAAT